MHAVDRRYRRPQPPGDDVAREVVQRGRQTVPAPVGDLEVGDPHLTRGCRVRHITGQPALAGCQELLRPAVVHRGGDALTAALFGAALLAAQSLSTTWIFSSAEYCQHV